MYKPKIIRQESIFKSTVRTELDAIELLIKDIDSDAEAQFAKEKDKKEKDEKEKSKIKIVHCHMRYRDNPDSKPNKNQSNNYTTSLHYAQTLCDLSK